VDHSVAAVLELPNVELVAEFRHDPAHAGPCAIGR
jgi:hypothetical protein